MTNLKINVLVPSGLEPEKITKEDVWGCYDHENRKLISDGMIVARGSFDGGNICPIFKDEIPYKSVTVICNIKDESDVVYWLEYVHGGGSISLREELEDGKIALRSDYQCW